MRSALSALAPSTQAASSRDTGTESMKFLSIHTAMGREVAVMKQIIPGIESIKSMLTKSEYTGTMSAVMGRQVPKRIVYMNPRAKRLL